MLTSLLAIDPGKTRCGYAHFVEGVLAECGMWTVGACFPCTPHAIVCEVPSVYDTRGRRGDQQDLISVAVSAGRAIEASGAVVCELVQPRTWKGQVPKKAHHARMALVLKDDEMVLLSGQDHNVWDAVGLGLWKLKRM